MREEEEEEEQQQLFLDAAARGARYLSTIRDRSVAPVKTAVDGLARLGGSLEAKGMNPSEVLTLLDEVGS